MKIESRVGKSSSSDQEIYTFITNFNNFKDLLPEDKVSDWESTEEECSFRVDPVGRTGLRIIEKEPYKLVKMASDPILSSHQFTIWVQLKQMTEGDTRVKITIEPRVNMMVLSMVRGPLKNFADGLVDKIEQHQF
jgi:carbon monoxide dehydrogenase subunit G